MSEVQVNMFLYYCQLEHMSLSRYNDRDEEYQRYQKTTFKRHRY